MKLIRIEGPAVTLACMTCRVLGVGGSQEYTNASRGEVCTPDEWYREDDPDVLGAYCAVCAAKLAQQDEARSVNQFFSDTAGNEVLPENLPDF